MTKRPRQQKEPLVVRDVQDDDSDIYMIGIRASTDPEADGVIFIEGGDDPDLDDPEQGMDTYCLTVVPGQATEYGGVTACVADGNTLQLTLTRETADALGLPEECTFLLDVPTEQTTKLHRGLRRVLLSGRPDAWPILIGF